MGDLIQTITTNFVVGGLALFAISLGFFSINYLNRRRQMLHQERMASLIKGLHYAGVARDVFGKAAPKAESRQYLFSGVRWLAAAAGISTAAYGYETMQPVADAGAGAINALVGLIPAVIGLVQLLFSWITRKKAAAAAPAGAGPVYRVAVRRY